MSYGYISESQGKLGACALKLKKQFPCNTCKLFEQREYDVRTPSVEHTPERVCMLFATGQNNRSQLWHLLCSSLAAGGACGAWWTQLCPGEGALTERCWGSRGGTTCRHQVKTARIVYEHKRPTDTWRVFFWGWGG